MTPKAREPNRYAQIIERIFFSRYRKGASEVIFKRDDIIEASKKLKIKVPKNVSDVLYSFRFRSNLPQSIRNVAPPGLEWIIRFTGRAQYSFAAVHTASILPSREMAETKVPDATPGVIAMYNLSDEQALLAKLRYNRLIDVFTGVTCYSLQNHLRTAVRGVGQVETDELYVGVDKRGAHYVFPVQAKGGSDRLSVVQVEQDLAVCETKFPNLICRPIGAQFMRKDLIALFEFEVQKGEVRVTSEKHYRLVEPDQMSDADLAAYRSRRS